MELKQQEIRETSPRARNAGCGLLVGGQDRNEVGKCLMGKKNNFAHKSG